MEKHLILLDLDGTLLNEKSRISDFNKQVIDNAQRHGHEVIIVTGRAHYRSHMFYEELHLKSLMVNRNASYIHAPFNKEYEHVIEWIDSKTVDDILNSEIMGYMTKMYIENLNNIYVLKGEKTFYASYPLCKVIDYQKQNLSTCSNLISISVENQYLEKTQQLIDKLPMVKTETYSMRDEMSLVNLYPVQSDKANAFKHLSDYYQVPLERIIAMGDGGNDIRMIKEAGIGVAMSNAINEVKEHAKIITDYSNVENGVGLFLKDYLKLSI